jgi:hypothetical protein
MPLKVGDSFVTRKQASEGTGLTESRFRTALEHLKDAKLVTTRKKVKGRWRGLIYSICNYPTTKSKGYFKVYRNILEKPWLFKDPELLRAWTCILSRAARKMSENNLPPGQIIIYPETIKACYKISLLKSLRSLKKLEDRKCIRYYRDDEMWHITIKNWRVYQGDNVYPIKQKKKE